MKFSYTSNSIATLYYCSAERFAPLHQIIVNKEVTDLMGFLFDHLNVPFMGRVFCKFRVFKEHFR